VALGGCATAYSVKIPLTGSGGTADVSRVTLEDQRAAPSPKVKLSNGLVSCERWYPDSTFQPSKVEFLRQRLAAHVPDGTNLRVTLTKFDTIEFCDDSSARASAAAVGGATGVFIPSAGVPNGDRFELRIAGLVDGKPFDLTRAAAYSDLNVLTMPGTIPEYQQRVAAVFDAAAAEIVTAANAARTPR
jgi:hypothetical protein